MYRPLCENITLTIKEGKVTNIQGGGEAQEYRKILSDLRDPQVYLTAEVGVGFHPQAVLSGTPLEDERIFGAAWIGIGTNVHIGGSIKAKIHSDCVMLPPVTLSLDGRVLLKDRQFNV
jgi:leucyl aminopeptidase (aminopeptidase T)